MSLIQCPECKGQVSSFANACPHCGFPIKDENSASPSSVANSVAPPSQDNSACLCIISGAEVDLSEVWKLVQQGDAHKIAAIGKLRDITGCRLAPAKEFVEQLYKTKNIPVSADLGDTNLQTMRVVCPACRRNNVSKIEVGSRLMGGFLFGAFSPESRAQFRCMDCGYMF